MLELISTIRQQETALAELQGRMGGLMLVQAGQVEALEFHRDRQPQTQSN